MADRRHVALHRLKVKKEQRLRRSESNRLAALYRQEATRYSTASIEHNMRVIRTRYPSLSEPEVQATIQRFVLSERACRLKRDEIWSDATLSDQEKAKQLSDWQAEQPSLIT